jgi:hypothetical protein
MATFPMRIPQALTAIHALHDLPLLVAALGHEPRWEPLEAVGWADGAWRRAARVGEEGGFAWYGLEASDPAGAAVALAGRLARRGELAGVVALDPEHRALAFAVQAGDHAEWLALDLERPARLGLACLSRFRGPVEGRLAVALRLADALSGRGTGRAFFRAFAGTLDRMADALPAPIPRADRRALALVQLTRVLFLYFVQSRGWLDGREAFLAEEVDRALAARRPLHRSLFRPLFFGTLNRRPEERRRALGFGRIPFLNGGLFEPHPLERRWPADPTDASWREAFDGLFERFHFTVVEGEAGPSIAPDALGRVFEGVMEPARRRASGAYYTPAALVRRVVDAALAARFDGRPPTLDDLEGLTALDPAAGSGAFLLGALDRLAECRRLAGDESPRVRRQVLAGLVGVDRDPMAVRLAELRLWLAVLAEEGDVTPEEVTPLPNLDCLVRQGDSLLEPHEVLGAAAPPADLAASLRALRGAALVASGLPKRRAREALACAERDLLRRSLTSAEEAADRMIGDLLAGARAPTLFGGRAAPGRGTGAALARLRERRRRVRAARRELERDGALPWFRFESHFADVFAARGGFDLVLGNPPWVRAEELPAGLRARLRERCRWWRSGAGAGYSHQPDLAVAFLERAWGLTAPGGTMALLVPSKVATASYGSAARQGLAAQGRLDLVAPVPPREGERFAATAYPMALVASRRTPLPGHRVRGGLEPAAPGAPQAGLTGGGPWIITPDPLRDALGAMGEHPRVAERWSPRLGAKTGANDAFVDPAHDVEAECIRLALRGREVQPFRAAPRHRLLWPHDDAGRPLPVLPPGAARHLRRHRDRLVLRADADPRLPWWACFRAGAGRPVPRVAWADLARRLQAAPLVGAAGARIVPLNTCYVILASTEDEALGLAAWLNCSWLRAAAAHGADEARGGYRRFGARVVGALPLPPAAVHDRDLVAIARRGAERRVQEELDARAADLLGLSAAHRRALALAPELAAAGR